MCPCVTGMSCHCTIVLAALTTSIDQAYDMVCPLPDSRSSAKEANRWTRWKHRIELGLYNTIDYLLLLPVALVVPFTFSSSSPKPLSCSGSKLVSSSTAPSASPSPAGIATTRPERVRRWNFLWLRRRLADLPAAQVFPASVRVSWQSATAHMQ